MRWRIEDVNPETRNIARAAAKAAGLPLGAWLDHAIRSHVNPSDVNSIEPPAPEVEAARIINGAPLPAAMPVTPAVAADEIGQEAAEPQSSGSHADVAAAPDEKPTQPRGRPPSPLHRHTIGLLGAAVVAAALIGGAIWLWPPSTTTDGRDATVASSTQAPSPSQPPAAGEEHAETGRPPPAAAPAVPQTLEQIIEGLQRDAAAGDAMAQHDLALAYVNGHGIAQNYETAAAWFDKAAQAGLERAQFNLAVLYENALGVPQDFDHAFSLYQAAAEQGFGPAQHNVAVAYAQGRGTSRDYHAAALWFRRAADQGIASAQFNLGMIYEKGLAGAPDEETAYGWYRRAAAAGSEAALARLTTIEGRIASPPPATKPGPAANPAGKPAKPTRAEVAEIQRLLGRLSFTPGPVDGKAGKATRDAIRQYQQVAGLPATGEPSGALLAHLQQVVGMMDGGSR